MKKLHKFFMAFFCLFLLSQNANTQTSIWDFAGLADLNEFYQLPCTPNPATVNGLSVSWPTDDCINGNTAISIIGPHSSNPTRPVKFGYGGLNELTIDISGFNFNKLVFSGLFNSSRTGVCLRDALGNDIDCDYDDLGPNSSLNNFRDYLLFNYDLTATQLVIKGGTFDQFTFISAVDQCFSPVNSTATASGSTATISWPANFEATKYRIKYRKKGVGDTWTVLKPTDPMVTISLELGTEYEYRLSTKCVDGWQPYEEKQTFWTEALEPCQAPQIISVHSVHSTKYKFVWTEVQDAEKYRIRYRIVGDIDWTVLGSTNNKKSIDLLAATNYEYELTTRCAGVWEPYGVTNNLTTFDECENIIGLSVEVATDSDCSPATPCVPPPPNVSNFRTVRWNTNSTGVTFQIQYRPYDVDPGPIFILEGDGWDNVTTSATGTKFYHENISQFNRVAYRMRANCPGDVVSEWSEIFYSQGFPSFKGTTGSIYNSTDENVEIEFGKVRLDNEFGIDVPLNTDNVSIFPNPATSQINIKIDQGNVSHIYIKDMQGRTLQQNAVLQDQANLQQDISKLNIGVYLIVLRNENGEQITKRFVKMN